MAQETDIGKSWEEIVRAYAKAERELGVKVYCVLRICKKVNGEEIVLHRYDMPREILQRWRWVINWRMAKLTCENPRAHIYETLSFYDKTSGEAYGFNSDLSRLTALKGRITLQENRIKDYIEANKDNLFFDETNDPQLVKVRKKLERARKNVANAEARLRTKVEQKIAGKYGEKTKERGFFCMKLLAFLNTEAEPGTEAYAELWEQRFNEAKLGACAYRGKCPIYARTAKKGIQQNLFAQL